MVGYLGIAASCVVIYVFILAAIRLFGKTEISQLSVIDLIFILLISNAVQNAMVGSDSSLPGGLVAAGTLFLVNFLFKQLIYRFPKLGRMLQGGPLLLIYKGEVNKGNLERARLTMDELAEAVREHGVAGVRDVDLAVLEADGNISIISDDFTHRTSKKKVPRKITRDNG